MDLSALAHKLGLRKFPELLRKANADAGPPPQHFHVSGEEQKQCAKCQAWQREFEAIFERVFAPYEGEDHKAVRQQAYQGRRVDGRAGLVRRDFTSHSTQFGWHFVISEKLVVVRTCFLRLDRPGFRAAQLGHGGQVLDSDLRVYGNFLTCLRRGMILVPAVCGHHGVGTGSKDSCVHRCLSRNDRGRCHKLAIH